MSATVATVCEAMARVLDQEYAAAAALLQDTMPRIDALGGSAAQREVLEETLIDCLVHDGQLEAARLLLDRRLERRPSPLDGRRREVLATSLLAG